MSRTPQNDFTRMIERVSQGNAMGEFGGGGAAMASPRPTVSSAAMGREIIESPPLSLEERMELDRKAAELGILPPTDVSQDLYATMEDALRAAGVDPEADPAPTSDPVEALNNQRRMPQAFPPQPGHRQETVREVVKVVETVRMPDFTKVQGMDLKKGVVFLDSMEFEIPAANLRKLRQFVVELARRSLLEKLEAAVGLFAREAPSDAGAAAGESETV